MRATAFISVLFLLCSCVCTGLCLAQETTGDLEGRVLDDKGVPVVLAIVTVSGPSLQGVRTTITGYKGDFQLFQLPVGIYTVRVSHVSHHPVTYEDVTIRLGMTTTLPRMSLAWKVYEAEELAVSAATLPIDLTTASMGYTLPAKEYASLPLDRSYQGIITLVPQVNESFLGDEANFAGSTGDENKYFIDGAEATEPNIGDRGTSLPYNFIREVRVRPGGYEAEYRSSLGGGVDLITHSGSNETHGQVFGFFLNNRLAADPRQTPGDPLTGNYTYYDVGFSLRGPLKTDRLWYAIAYNPSFEDDEIELPGLGPYTTETTIHRFAGKLTWKVNDSNDLVFSVFGDPTDTEGPAVWLGAPTAFANPDPVLRDIASGSVNGSIHGRHWLSDNLLLESSIALSRFNDRLMPLTTRGREEPYFEDTETGIVSGGAGGGHDRQSIVSTLGAKGTLSAGSHTLKSGLEYKDNRLDDHWEVHIINRYADPVEGEQFLDVFVWEDGVVSNRVLSAFMQDSWRFSDRLRLNYGLRWDGQFWIDSKGKVAQHILDQWQPRLGVVYQPGRLGSQKVYASAGRFYQETATFPFTWMMIDDYVWRIALFDHDPRLDPSNPLFVDETIGYSYEKVNGLKGQYFDEFALGYELALTPRSAVTVRGAYRILRDGIEDVTPDGGGTWLFGNPGSGKLSEFPRMRRDYSSLEVTYQYSGGERYNMMFSYVLSRNYGNYPGLFGSDFGWHGPNISPQFDLLDELVDGTGLLPNDRPHVLKFSGSYRVIDELDVGLIASWQSGTPLNEWGSSPAYPNYRIFLVPRGEAGRTPSVRDVNLRMAYRLPKSLIAGFRTRMILDLLHIGSQREAVAYDQTRYLGVDDDGNQAFPNPTYGLATKWQPPMAVRLGLEVDF
jgi:hypothetical protein